MDVRLPLAVVQALAALEARPEAFSITDVEAVLAKAIQDPNSLTPEESRGLWAERTAFALSTRQVPGGGPFGTYFQPRMTNLNDADDDVLEYWIKRSIEAKHPVLVARYADIVWDLSKVVASKDLGRERFECARRAIDAYLAAAQIDKGGAWGDSRTNLGRALQISMSINDSARIEAAVEAIIQYVTRTTKDDKIGTFVYLFDYLLPPKKGPDLSADQETKVVQMFETKFAAMTVPGSGWDVEPYGPRDVGSRLADYYGRKGDEAARKRVLEGIAGVIERRGKMGDPLTGLMFLQEARKYYLDAGLRHEAERVQLEAQRMGPEAEKRLARTTVSHEIPKEDLDRYLEAMVEGGTEAALKRIALHFLPGQREIKERAEETARQHPLHAIFSGQTAKLGHGHIEANVGDESGDPDGKMIHETAQQLQLAAPWLGWVFERMTDDGLTTESVLDFLSPSPLFEEGNLPIVRQGLEAHFSGDYVQAIHLLIPQIERALTRLPPLAGKPSNKAHRSGRGVMQFKNLNDLLAQDEWPIQSEDGENLRMYLLSTLAHPKGWNIRNDVCHGLWSARHFTQQASERVLHVLLAVSLIRDGADGGQNEAAEESTGDPPEASPEGFLSRLHHLCCRLARKLLRVVRSA